MKLRPSATLETVTRCSYCRADDGELSSCDACGTLTHTECLKEHGRCPTLGCAKAVRAESLAWRIGGGWGGATGAGGQVVIQAGNGTGYGAPRREGVYDTETWTPQNTPVAHSLALPWPTLLFYSNQAHPFNYNFTQTPITNPINPIYLTSYLDGILTRGIGEFEEPTETDPMNGTREQF